MATGTERMRAWRERKRAAGYVFRNGRAVYQPEGPAYWVGLRAHGTPARWRQGCRCDPCRLAYNADKQARRRRAR